ncbi:hypothetical protein BPAP50_gp10 [Bacillus phage AP50]|uniref:Uncharacterized protein n=1 Tax=Bacillus phage AP50 TaxID=2880538 RepID=B6RT42_9VIRU|nr:hypothetical protein BPAP50_gp10 [Bacillus phage AP50]ACB54909.1 hypothetical protein [Bacillus phage AP50]
MFKTLSKLYRDLLHQNIDLHNENTKLRLQNARLQSKLATAEIDLYHFKNSIERMINK